MWVVINARVIMHNRIIGSECGNPVHDPLPYEFQGPLAAVDHDVLTNFADFIAMHTEILDEIVHRQLQNDMMKYLWTHNVLYYSDPNPYKGS